MWRVLTQLPTLITECIGHLRTISWLCQQQLLLHQETNLLLREMIVKITTQPAETPPAVDLAAPQTPAPIDPSARHRPEARDLARATPRRILTEHDISRQTRSTMAEEQFRQESLKRYPHRQGEQVPSEPHTTPTPATRPLGGPPGV